MARKSNFEIAFQLGAKMDPSVKKAFGDAQKRIGGMQKNIGKALKTGAKVAAGFGAAVVGIGASAFAATMKVTDGFDKIAKASSKLGVSTDAYQEMNYWAGQNGIEHGQFEKAVGRLNQRIGLAMDGNDKYAGALNQLGVNLDDVRDGTMTTEDAMAKSIQTLSEMESEHKKVALATDLFGVKLARDLMPALQDGSLSLEDAKKKAEELGIVVGEDSLRAAEAFNDTWDDLSSSIKVFGQKGIAYMMPFFQKVMDFAIDKLPSIQNVASNVFGKISNVIGWLGDTGTRIFKSIKNAISESFNPTRSFGDLMSEAGDFLRNAFEMAQPYIEWFINDGIPKAVGVIADLVDRAKEVYRYVADNWEKISPIVYGIIGALAAYKVISTTVAAAIALKTIAVGTFGAVLAFVTSPIGIVILAIGALIAIGIALYKNWDTIKENLLMAWEKVKMAMSELATNMKEKFTEAYNWVIGIFTGIGEWFAGKFFEVKTVAAEAGLWIGDKFIGAYEAVTGLFSGIGSWFGGIFDNVVNVFKGKINAMIGIANSAIGGLNNLSVSIPDWVPGIGGNTFGLNIPKIPMLAEGGITTGPTLAMIGEGREQEAVLPLSKLKALLGIDEDGGNGTTTDKNSRTENNTTNEGDSEGMVFHYNPIIEIQGNASQQEMAQVVKESHRDFEQRVRKVMDRYEKSKKRVTLA